MPKIRFEFTAPGARKVCLAGGFNAWDPEGRRMKRVKQGEDLFVCVVNLDPGCYQYKFVVDGEWQCAPDGPRALDEWGHENSVLEVCC